MDLIKKFDEFLNENKAFEDYLYIEDNKNIGVTLWTSYAPGSGTTKYFKNKEELLKTYLTDKPEDKNTNEYDVKRIVDWSSDKKPVIKKANSKLYEIPSYQRLYRGLDYKDFDIFGGDEKPDYKVYLLLQLMGSGYYIINFFKTKKEARAFAQI